MPAASMVLELAWHVSSMLLVREISLKDFTCRIREAVSLASRACSCANPAVCVQSRDERPIARLFASRALQHPLCTVGQPCGLPWFRVQGEHPSEASTCKVLCLLGVFALLSILSMNLRMVF